ncbi:MAG: DNA methyltransferase [Planctomycetota bacterium]
MEDAQKRLFEKKKFVLRTDYLATIRDVPKSLWPEVIANKAQLAEWKDLYGLKGRIDEDVLRKRPTLVVDTSHFPADFSECLLSAVEDIDATTGGLLIHGENYQALSVLQARFREAVQCVYIDPPYNSKTTEIAYKNSYKHSSWAALMQGRLELSRSLAARDGSHVVAIDENEQEVLGQVLSMVFPYHEKICVSVVHNKKGIQGDYFSYNNDFAYFCIPQALAEIHGTTVPESEWEYDNLRKWGRESERSTAKNCF